MTELQPIVFVVDDDKSVRKSLERLIRSAGLRVETFASARQFLAGSVSDLPGCLVLDVKLPGLSGLELQAQMSQSEIDIPIIFITGHGDIPMSVRAIKAGAVEFLTKPFRDQDLLDAIEQAIERHRAIRSEQAGLAELRRRFDSLTPRERQVMNLVATGLLNKQAAARLGISEATVKIHRGQVMQKMKADSLADLVKMSEKLEIPRADR
ncbi:MAG: response regulator transcription factor [Acidobacteria bacterium]|nr:response regulator transcription factor [Acidobacteriota bacterium]